MLAAAVLTSYPRPSDNPPYLEMNLFKNEGGLQYRFRRLTKEQYEAELAAESDEIGQGPVTPTTEVGNASRKAQASVSNPTVSDMLADSLKRQASGQGPKKLQIEITERKV